MHWVCVGKLEVCWLCMGCALCKVKPCWPCTGHACANWRLSGIAQAVRMHNRDFGVMHKCVCVQVEACSSFTGHAHAN